MTVASDEFALAEAIGAILNDGAQRDKLAQSAFETVQQQFTVQHTAQQLLALYQNLQR